MKITVQIHDFEGTEEQLIKSLQNVIRALKEKRYGSWNEEAGTVFTMCDEDESDEDIEKRMFDDDEVRDANLDND